MSKAMILADAHDAVGRATIECNAAAGRLLAEVAAYRQNDAEWILAADIDRVMELTMDLTDARAKLAKAKVELDALRRRQ